MVVLYDDIQRSTATSDVVRRTCSSNERSPVRRFIPIPALDQLSAHIATPHIVLFCILAAQLVNSPEIKDSQQEQGGMVRSVTTTILYYISPSSSLHNLCAAGVRIWNSPIGSTAAFSTNNLVSLREVCTWTAAVRAVARDFANAVSHAAVLLLLH